MINWNELIGAEKHGKNADITITSGATKQAENPENTSISGARPTTLHPHSEKVGRIQTNDDNGFSDSAPLAPLAPLKNQGVGYKNKKQESNRPVEGGASDDYCATKTHR